MESSLLQVKDVPAPLIPHFIKFIRSFLSEGCLLYSKITLHFVHNLYDLVFWLKYFIYFIFQILHFIFFHANFSFLCQNSYQLFVITCSITLLAHFIYEYIFNLWITFYIWIYYTWILSNNKTLYILPQHYTATKP